MVDGFFDGLHPSLADATPSGLCNSPLKALKGRHMLATGIAHRPRVTPRNPSPERALYKVMSGANEWHVDMVYYALSGLDMVDGFFRWVSPIAGRCRPFGAMHFTTKSPERAVYVSDGHRPSPTVTPPKPKP